MSVGGGSEGDAAESEDASNKINIKTSVVDVVGEEMRREFCRRRLWVWIEDGAERRKCVHGRPKHQKGRG